MGSIDGNIIVAVVALIINLITIIKFTNALENRLTKLETILERAITPNIKKLERMVEAMYKNTGKRKDE
jgi:CHASE1-domain containing sensor protein